MATATDTERRVEYLSIEAIRTDGGTQARVGFDEETAEEMALLLVGDFEFPPGLTFFDGESHWLADGHYRRRAYELAHFDAMPCEIREGTQQDAQWYAYAANKSHGVRRSNDDKANAVKLALKHPKGAELADTVIADHVGVSEQTVAKYRQELEATSEIGKSAERVGKDGRARKVSSEKRSSARKDKKGSKPAAEPVAEKGAAGNFQNLEVQGDATPPKNNFPNLEVEEPDDSNAEATAPVIDELGSEVPEEYTAAFECRAQFDEIGRRIDALRRDIEELAKSAGGFYLAKDVQSISKQLQNLKGQFAYSAPYAYLPKKKNQPKWVSKFVHKQMGEGK